MNTNKRATIALSIFAVVLAVTAVTFAQPRVGGYKNIATDDEGVAAAADFAVDAESKREDTPFDRGAIVKAERQIVAGSNYRLCMEVSAYGANSSFVQVVVYADLKNHYRLTSWEVSTCDEGDKSTAAAVDSFKPLEKNHAGAGLAADFAVKEKSKTMKPGYKLDEVVKAESTSGTGSKLGTATFRDCMKVSLNGKASFVQAVVSMDQ